MTRPPVSLESLTWTELEDRLESGSRTVIVPVASIEQHGPHLPLATDTIIGEELAERIARSLGNALVAPAVRPGVSSVHTAFPGTLSVPSRILMDTLRACIRSLDAHGFEHVAFLSTHGGNFPPVNSVVPELAKELETRVFVLGNLRRYMELLNEGLANAGVKYEEPVVHAGATETAVMLAIDDSLVREDAVPTGYEGDLSAATLFSEGIGHFTESGVLGDATRATETAGKRILEVLTAAYVSEVEAELSNDN